MKLAVPEGSILRDEFEGVYAETRDRTDGGWNASGAEEVKKRMDTFGLGGVEVPELYLSDFTSLELARERRGRGVIP